MQIVLVLNQYLQVMQVSSSTSMLNVEKKESPGNILRGHARINNT